jgi:hypothetical protein
MIVTKKSLSRRTMLRGLGAAVALPFLDAMVPAFAATATSAANPPTKFGFLYIPHGVHRPEWTPTTEGTGFEFTRILKPLEPLRNYVNVVSNLNLCRQPLPTGHFYGSAMWLNGTHPNEGSEVRMGKTVDQMIVEKYGQDTPLPSLELCTEDVAASNGACEVGLACVYGNTISWREATTPLPMELDPKVVFERLFGEGGGASAKDRADQIDETVSILDAITHSTGALRSKLGAEDQTRLSDYLESVREIERRIQRSASATQGLTLPVTPAGVPDSFDEQARLLFDLMVLAYQGNVTRVISFMMARELSPRTYPFIGVPDGHHSTSHNGEMPIEVEKFVTINTYHVQVVADFLKKMQSIPDGDGSLLDHSLILYGSGMGNSNLHSHERIPIVVAGGASGQLKGGRHIVAKDDTPLSNLLMGILDRARVPVDHVGDSNGMVQL